MNVERVKIADLKSDPANVRRHPERNIQALRSSLMRFGQQKPIVVDAHNVVRAGNGMLEAARQLGWETILAVRTDLTGTEAAAYAIADNRTADLAEWDEAALADMLRTLQAENFDLDAIGYTQDEADRLLQRLNAEMAGQVVESPWEEWHMAKMPEFHQEPKGVRTIHVHFREASAVEDFARIIGCTIIESTRFLWFPPE